jgi:hypothetical protein
MQYRSVLAFLVLCSVAQAEEATVEPALVPISTERAKECEAGGGCAYVTKAEMQDMAEKMFEAGQRYANATCASRTGLR